MPFPKSGSSVGIAFIFSITEESRAAALRLGIHQLYPEQERAVAASLERHDVLVVLPIYAASEDPIEGVNAAALSEGIKAHGHRHVVCVDGLPAAVARLHELLTPGDLLLTLGAGDVWKAGAEFLKGAA